MSVPEENKLKIALLDQKLSRMDRDIQALRVDIQGLLEAWNTSTGLVKFIKVISTVAFTCSLVWFLGVDMIERFFHR